MEKDMKELLKDFEEACYRHAYAGSLHPVDAHLVEIGYGEVKFQLYTGIEELESRLEIATAKIDDMVEAERYHEETKDL